ncbi:hypothetical protein WP1_100 [Pseudomonas phage WP1]
MNPLLPIVHIMLKDGEVPGPYSTATNLRNGTANLKDAAMGSWVME